MKMNGNSMADEVSRVMDKIRQKDHYCRPASSSITLEKIVEILASERDEWKFKAQELERQLDRVSQENYKLRSALEKEREALRKCTADRQNEISEIMVNKNEQMQEVLGYLTSYKSQLLSTIEMTNESEESKDNALKPETINPKINDFAQPGPRVAHLLGFRKEKSERGSLWS
jgi:predicted  nucleic acid-binding Zn-ribbon protein